MDKKKIIIWGIAATANLANLADAITTLVALNTIPIAYEGMALSKLLIDINPIFFIVVKLSVVFYATAPLRYAPMGYLLTKKKYSHFLVIIILCLAIIYFGNLALGNLLLL